MTTEQQGGDDNLAPLAARGLKLVSISAVVKSCWLRRERAGDAFGVLRDNLEISTVGLIGLRAPLFPVAQRA